MSSAIPASSRPEDASPGSVPPAAPIRREAVGGPGRWWRRLLVGLGAAHFAVVVVGLLWMGHQGERHWIAGTLLFMPPAYWALPLVVLTPLSWAFARGACAWHGATAAFLLVFYLPSARPDPTPDPTPPGGSSFLLVDNNLGQRRIGTLLALVKEVRPDIVVLQEVSPGTGDNLRRGGVLGPHFAQQDEFVVAGRFPIVRSGLLEQLSFNGAPVAAWFELEQGGAPLVIYNVHLPTPRPDFYLLRGNGFFKGWIRGGGIYSSEVREAYRGMLARRVAVAEELVRVLEAERRPFLVVGDFNAPSPGHVRRLFASRWTDAFAVAGQGYGLTFPGVTRNPLSLFGPWLRLDYLFASRGIRPVECWVEPREPAQHRALVARLERSRDLGSQAPPR